MDGEIKFEKIKQIKKCSNVGRKWQKASRMQNNSSLGKHAVKAGKI